MIQIMATGITIRNVAKRAGVSIKTVSRVLNGERYVSLDKKKRVEAAAKRLKYRPNIIACEFRAQRTKNVAFFYFNAERRFAREYYYSEIFDTAHKALLDHGYSTSLIGLDQVPNDCTGFLIETVRNRKLSGILLADMVGCDYDQIRKERIPCVVFNRPVHGEKLASVSPTNALGGYDATKFLLKSGHRRIGFLGKIASRPCSLARFEGYRRALSEEGLAPDPHFAYEWDGSATETVSARLRALVLQEKLMPTAIFACTDNLAIVAMTVFQEAGWRIPEDISIVGFDDLEPASLVTPKLTTVHAPLDEMAGKAVQKLMEMINGTGRGEIIECATRLVLRDSACFQTHQRTNGRKL